MFSALSIISEILCVFKFGLAISGLSVRTWLVTTRVVSAACYHSFKHSSESSPSHGSAPSQSFPGDVFKDSAGVEHGACA